MSTHELPARPHLDHLKQQAKSLLREAKAGDPAACRRIAAQHPRPLSEYTLATAQHAVAREYGFASWPKLKIHVELTSKNLAEKADQFLEVAWHWGDRARAEVLVTDEPAIARSSIFAAAAYGDDTVVAELLKQGPGVPSRRTAARTGRPCSMPLGHAFGQVAVRAC